MDIKCIVVISVRTTWNPNTTYNTMGEKISVVAKIFILSLGSSYHIGYP